MQHLSQSKTQSSKPQYLRNISVTSAEKEAIQVAYIDCGGVDVEFFENSECLFIEFVRDGDVRNVRCIVVVKLLDVLHHSCAIRFNCRQNEKILQVPSTMKQLSRCYNFVANTTPIQNDQSQTRNDQDDQPVRPDSEIYGYLMICKNEHRGFL